MNTALEAMDAANECWAKVKDIPSDEDAYGPFGRRRPEFRPVQYARVWKNGHFVEVDVPGRSEITEAYCWAIPAPESLRWILDRLDGRGVVEMGAGTGYWAWMLSLGGADVVAYDRNPPGGKTKNQWRHKKTYFDVQQGTPKALAQHQDRVLLLSWPPYNEEMAAECLRNYPGDTLIYLGEEVGGCTGSDAFFDLLAQDWTFQDKCVEHPAWNGLYDGLRLYKRK